MIGREIKGRSFRPLLDYLERKDGTQRIGGNMTGNDKDELVQEFESVCARRRNLKRTVFHGSLRPAPGESLSIEQWNAIADRFLLSLGFRDCPYVVYLHTDAPQHHIHIVASRISYHGNVVPDGNDYYRAMRALRLIERDYGLRIVPASVETDRRPRTSELKRVARSGGPSVRSALKQAIREAARVQPLAPGFVRELRRTGIEVRFRRTASGRIAGISYGFGGLRFSGSSLGPAFSWAGLANLGVRYLPERDDSALGPTGPPSTSPREDSVQKILATWPRADAAKAVSMQLAAIGSPMYDIAVRGSDGTIVHARSGWTAEQVERAIGWLRHQAANGGTVLVRPSLRRDTPAILVPGITAEAIEEARSRGFEPAAVVARADGVHDIWLRHPRDLSRVEAAWAGALLAQEFRSRDSWNASDWGRLAGFPERAGTSDAPAFAELREAARREYSKAPALLAAVRDRLLRSQSLREVDSIVRELPDVGSLERELARELAVWTGGLPLPPSHDPVTIAWQVENLRKLEKDFATAQDAVASAHGADRLLEVVELRRVVNWAREELAAQAGLATLPDSEGLAVLPDYAALRGRELAAREHLDAVKLRRSASSASSTEHAEAELAHQIAQEAARSFEANHHLRPAEEFIPRTAIPELEARFRAFSEAAEASRTLQAELRLVDFASEIQAERRLVAVSLDQIQHEIGLIERATRDQLPPDGLRRLSPLFDQAAGLESREEALAGIAAALERRRLGREIHRLEGELLQAATQSTLDRYTSAVTARLELERRWGVSAASRPAAAGAAPRLRLDPGEEQAALRRAAARFLARPTEERLGELRSALGRHFEVAQRSAALAAHGEQVRSSRNFRRASHELAAAPAGREAQERWAQSYTARAEADLGRVPIEVNLGGDRLHNLLGRLRQGDLSPETLNRLQREVARQIEQATGSLRLPSGPRPTREDLLGAVATYRSDRAQLLAASRPLRRHHLLRRLRGDTVTVEQLRGFQEALARFQDSSRQLDVLTQRFIQGPQRRVLPVRYFLAHPNFARAPHRAVLAWSVHAARLGVSPQAARNALARTNPHRYATPRLHSSALAGAFTWVVGRWLVRAARRAVLDQARGR